MQSRSIGVIGNEAIYRDSEMYLILEEVFQRLALFSINLRTSGTLGIESIALDAYKKALDEGIIIPDRIQVFQPWRDYSNIIPYAQCYTTVGIGNFDVASNLIRSVHPYWSSASKQTKLQHAKNALIVFGRKLTSPLDALIIYSPVDSNGNIHGNITSAVELANKRNIPVFNLGDKSKIDLVFKEFRTYLRSLGYPVINEDKVETIVS